jgi:putative SOS response-associated peptidase YedK
MCGRFTQQRPTSELAEIFDAENLADDPGGHFNVAPPTLRPSSSSVTTAGR